MPGRQEDLTLEHGNLSIQSSVSQHGRNNGLISKTETKNKWTLSDPPPFPEDLEVTVAFNPQYNPQ